MKIQIEKEKVQSAYKDACGDVKEVLIKMFGKEVCETAKPTLDDYKTIRTYEDACVALRQDAIRVDSVNGDTTTVLTNGGDRVNMPSHIVALMKLETISRALWGKNFQPEPDAEGKKTYWYPWFALYTKKGIESMSEEKRKSIHGALFGGNANNGANAGFGYLLANNRSSYSLAPVGFRLCQETREKAAYFGKQFIELWAEYLAFGFQVTGHLE